MSVPNPSSVSFVPSIPTKFSLRAWTQLSALERSTVGSCRLRLRLDSDMCVETFRKWGYGILARGIELDDRGGVVRKRQ